MQRWIWSAALAICAASSGAAAHAQQPGTPPASPAQPPAAAPRQGTVPDPANPLGVGNSPATTLNPTFTPGFGFDPNFNGFTPGFGFTGQTPFFFTTNPFFTGFNPFFGGVVTWTPYTGPISGSPINPGAVVANPAARLPVLGLNTPPAALARPARTSASGTAATGKATVMRTGDHDTPQQRHVAALMREIMKHHPVVTGEVVDKTNDGALVKVTVDGKTENHRYRTNEIFFFHGDDLMDATGHPELVVPGLEVMVPDHSSAS